MIRRVKNEEHEQEKIEMYYRYAVVGVHSGRTRLKNQIHEKKTVKRTWKEEESN